MESLKTREKQGGRKSSQNLNVLIPAAEEFWQVDNAPAQKFSQEYTRNGITIGISKNIDEISVIRPLWDKMQKQQSSNIPDTDYNKYVSVIRSMGAQTEPFVMYCKKDDRLLAMVIGRTQIKPLDLKLGYLTLFRPRLKCLTIVYGGIVGKPDDGLCLTLIDELMAQLQDKCADMLQLNFLRTDTTFYRAIRNISNYCPLQLKTDKHWRMAVPDTIDKFYSARSRGHRHNLRKAKSRFEKVYAGDIRYVNYTTEAEVEDFLKTAAQISKKTYQYALNSGLVNDESTRARIKADAANGWFRGHIVFANNKPCAFLLGLKYENIYYMVNMGYDPSFKSYNPGLILFLKVLEGLCYNPTIEFVDFYFGDAEYKNRYGTEFWYESNVCLFAPRMYPMFIKAIQGTTMYMDAGLKYVINKMGLVDKIKRHWRNLLSTKEVNRKIPIPTQKV
ncbi:MAG: GNAT family N-acetyltransferase [Sedimentisphaerales bacterium]|nr:GNAT family N-acetyltransferase [Sedimentisphaerales bacterium]